MALYDGANLFGPSAYCREIPNETAFQKNEFFGVDGTASLYGGQRGRMFEVKGILVDQSATSGPTLVAQIQTLRSYDDGIGRTFVDNLGIAWSEVVFRQWTPGERIINTQFGPALEFTVLFEGLQ
jgi:hypothetical protein